MQDKFGINVKQWCREHEAAVDDAISHNTVSEELISIHKEKMLILQHERLVHLIVTVMVVIVELFFTGLVLVHPDLGVLPAVIVLALAVLLGFYFYHYFFLENTVQRWYKLADALHAARAIHGGALPADKSS